MIDIGSVCRTREPILKTESGDNAHLCRIVAIVPEHRWRTPNVPEYKVQLLSKPVTAFCRERDLTVAQ